MTVSTELLQRARDKAILFLEEHIVHLAIILNVDIDTLDSTYQIPVESDDPFYASHYCLQQMVINLEALQ